MMFIDGAYPVISRHPVGLVGACFFPRFRPSGFFEHFVYPMCLLFTPEIMNWSFSNHMFSTKSSFSHHFPIICPHICPHISQHFPMVFLCLAATCPGKKPGPTVRRQSRRGLLARLEMVDFPPWIARGYW